MIIGALTIILGFQLLLQAVVLDVQNEPGTPDPLSLGALRQATRQETRAARPRPARPRRPGLAHHRLRELLRERFPLRRRPRAGREPVRAQPRERAPLLRGRNDIQQAAGQRGLSSARHHEPGPRLPPCRRALPSDLPRVTARADGPARHGTLLLLSPRPGCAGGRSRERLPRPLRGGLLLHPCAQYRDHESDARPLGDPFRAGRGGCFSHLREGRPAPPPGSSQSRDDPGGSRQAPGRALRAPALRLRGPRKPVGRARGSQDRGLARGPRARAPRCGRAHRDRGPRVLCHHPLGRARPQLRRRRPVPLRPHPGLGLAPLPAPLRAAPGPHRRHRPEADRELVRHPRFRGRARARGPRRCRLALRGERACLAGGVWPRLVRGGSGPRLEHRAPRRARERAPPLPRHDRPRAGCGLRGSSALGRLRGQAAGTRSGGARGSRDLGHSPSLRPRGQASTSGTRPGATANRSGAT